MRFMVLIVPTSCEVTQFNRHIKPKYLIGNLSQIITVTLLRTKATYFHLENVHLNVRAVREQSK